MDDKKFIMCENCLEILRKEGRVIREGDMICTEEPCCKNSLFLSGLEIQEEMKRRATNAEETLRREMIAD